MSSVPVRPFFAASADIMPTSAAWAACIGLVIDSERNACCSPAMCVVTLAIAFMNCSRLHLSTVAAAAAAPMQPMVAVVCQYT